MFNFQKEIVINDPNLIEVIEQGNENGKSPLGIKLRVNGGEADYFVKYIDGAKIYKTAPVDAVNGEIKIDLSNIKLESGEHMQIRLELGLDGDYRGDFGSALYYFRKPILVDVASVDKTVVAAALKKVAISSEKLFDVEAGEDTVQEGTPKVDVKKPFVKIVFADPVIKLRKGEIAVFAGGELDEVKNTIEVKMSKDNKPGFGTYEYVLHNLRMPTSANYRFNSPNAEEMPVKGQLYTQYSFSYTVPRPGLGGVSAAGQAIHSTTVHTLYVAAGETGCDAKFTDKSSGLTVVNASGSAKELPDVYASAQDAKVAAGLAANATADAEIKKQVDANKQSIKDNADADKVVSGKVTTLENKVTELEGKVK